MLVAFVALAIVSPKVTLTLPATPVTNAVKEIARASGQELYTDGSVSRDIVCVQVTDTPLEDLKAKLAETIGAIWIDRDGKQVLTRPDWLEKRQQDEAVDAKAKEIEKAIALRPELPPFDEGLVQTTTSQVNASLALMNENIIDETHDKARRRQWAALEGTPAHRLLERVLRKMDTRQLALLAPDLQVCYSNEPNASERRFPFDMRPLLKQFQTEQQLFQRTLTSKDTAKWNKVDDRRMYYYDADADCRRVLLIVSRNRSQKMPTFRLCLLDRDGWVTASPFLSLSPPPLSEKDVPKEPDAKIEYSADAQEWPQVLEGLFMPSELDEQGHSRRENLKPWLSRLLNPEKSEPLAFRASESLIEYAKIKNRHLVGLIPDRALWPVSPTPSVTLDAFAQDVRRAWKSEIVDRDGWLIVRPRLLADARAERIDREALGTFFRQIDNENRIGVDGAATYVVNAKSDLVLESYDQAAPGLAERFQGEFEPRQLTLWYYRALLRFLGKLSPVQRHSLLAGGTLTVGQMGVGGKAALEELVYSRDLIERLFRKPDVFNDDPKKTRGHASDEPWEKLPNGIPASSVVRCTPQEMPVIFTTETEERFILCWSPEAFGMTLAGDPSELGENLPKMYLGKGIVYNFSFEFTPEVAGSTTVREILPGKRNPYAKLDDFPAAIRDEIKAGFAKERDRLARRRNETGTTPPP